jgi:hypothetical protein
MNSKVKQTVAALRSRLDGRYQPRPPAPVQAELTSVDADTGHAFMSVERQSDVPVSVDVGTLLRAGDQVLVRRMNQSTTNPEYEIVRTLKTQDKTVTLAGVHAQLVAPTGVTLHPGSNPVAAGTYNSFLDVKWDVITSSYNYVAQGVQRYHLRWKQETAAGDQAWTMVALNQKPALTTGTLAGAILAGATSIAITKSVTGEIWPTRGNVQIEDDIVAYTGITDGDAGNTSTDTALTLTGCTGVASGHGDDAGVIVRSATYRINGLTPGIGYDVKVAAVKNSTEGPQSQVVNADALLDTSAPTFSAGDVETSNMPGGVMVSWPGSPDDDLKEYIVYKASDTAGTGAAEAGRTTSTHFFHAMDSGLTTYFNVKAADINTNTSGYLEGTWVAGSSLYGLQTNYLRNSTFLFGHSNWNRQFIPGVGSPYYSASDAMISGGYKGFFRYLDGGPAGLEAANMVYLGDTVGKDRFWQDIMIAGEQGDLAEGTRFSLSFYGRTQGAVDSADYETRVLYFDKDWAQIGSTVTLPIASRAEADNWVRDEYHAEDNAGLTVPATTRVIRVQIEQLLVVGALEQIDVTGFLLEKNMRCTQHQPFVLNTTETHQVQNLLPNTWQTSTSGWTLEANITRTTSLAAGLPVTATAGLTSAANALRRAYYTFTGRTFYAGQYLTFSVWSYSDTALGDASGQVWAVPAATIGTKYCLMSHQPNNVSTWQRLTCSFLLAQDVSDLTFGVNVPYNGYVAAPQVELGNHGTEYKPQLVDLETAQTITGAKVFGGGAFGTNTFYPMNSVYQAPMPVNAAGLLIGGALAANRSLYLLQWTVKTYVNTTNTGAAYWTVQLQTQNRATGAFSTIASATTQSEAPNTGIYEDIVSFSVNPISGATYGGLFLNLVKTGAPGTIYVDSTLEVQMTPI